jgi:DNA-binding NtrC family response regulator
MLQNLSILTVLQEDPSENLLVGFLKEKTAATLHHVKKPTEALAFIKENKNIELLVVDFFMPGKSGLKLVEEVCGANPAIVPVVVMPFGSREHIVESLQAGIYFYVNTPFDYQEILEVIKNAYEYQKLLQSSLGRMPKLRKSDGFEGIIGNSEPMRQMFDIIRNVTANDYGNVLLKGESGTGKELAAQAIHKLTESRSRHNFVPVNCAAIPDDLLESELFGYEKGAFTGAARSKKGRLAHADKGTLFLDEIGDMKPNMQAKLLRVIQEQAFEPIGSVQTKEIDVRVIAATNRDLKKAVKDGSFREDLFYRLSVIPITMPPLRDRKDDIEALIENFLLLFNRGRKTSIKGFTPRALEALKAHHWPGNVRELQNLVQRICILHGGATADIDALPKKFREQPHPETENEAPDSGNHLAGNIQGLLGNPGMPVDFHALTCEFENHLILQALNVANGNKKEAARLLNMKRTTLLEKIKKRQLDQKNMA